MAQLVRALHDRGVPLALATSKSRALALQIVEHTGLTECFTVQCGASADGSRAWKADIIEDALTALRAADVDVSLAVMVGDRDHDILGASAQGIRSVFVAWGYGTSGDAQGATAADIDHLAQLLGIDCSGAGAGGDLPLPRPTPPPRTHVTGGSRGPAG